MLTIKILKNELLIEGKKIEFPIPLGSLNDLLGTDRHLVLKYGQKHTWDAHGITGHSQDGENIVGLFISFKQEDYDFSPQNCFQGQLLINGVDCISYRNKHANQLRKSYKGDKDGKFVFADLALHYFFEDTELLGVELLKDDGKQVIAPLSISRENTIQLEEKYNYLHSLWESFKSETMKWVSIDNEYFNLQYGINDSQVEHSAQLESGRRIPDELIAFYKIYDLESNPVTSAFGFTTEHWDYCILPFEQIKSEWENLQDLNWEDTEEIADQVAGYSSQVQSNNYTSPAWIPFAEGKNGDYLLYDTDPSPEGCYGQIIELQNQSWSRKVVATSLSMLLESEIKRLQTGQVNRLDFIRGVLNTA